MIFSYPINYSNSNSYSNTFFPKNTLFNFASTVTRSSPYLIGILFGYFIDQLEKDGEKRQKFNKEKVLKKIYQYFFIALVGNFIVLPAIFRYLLEFFQTRIVAFTFESIIKVTLSTLCGLFIVILHFEKLKSVNEFLSMKLWTPIAKLSYCIYLVGPVIQLVRIKENMTIENFDHNKLVIISNCFDLELYSNYIVLISINRPSIT